MLDLITIARELRSWDHVRKFTLGNVELELAVSTLVLEAIALGGKREAERAAQSAKAERDSIRSLSDEARKIRLAQGPATRSDVAISNQEKPGI